MNYQSKQPPPLPAWPLRRLRKYRPRGAVPRSVVLRSFLDRYLGSAAQTHRWRCLINVIASRCGREQVRRNFSVTDVPWRTHSGGRSSPLTSCMPSRDPGKSSIMKPRITSRHTEAVVVTRGVLRGLVWLELLPRCCLPNDGELHVPRCSTTPPRGRGARLSHTALSMDCWRAR
jgi:hypothetical protein